MLLRLKKLFKTLDLPLIHFVKGNNNLLFHASYSALQQAVSMCWASKQNSVYLHLSLYLSTETALSGLL